MDSYDDYNLVDYEHQFTIKNSPYFLREVGHKIRTWQTTKSNTFTDVTGRDITIPPGTLMGAVDVTDPDMIRMIDNKQLTAFSVSIAEREDAETLKREYENSKVSTKSGVNFEAIERINKLLSNKRVMISDIEDPVMFSVTLTCLPCVNKAMFCENSLITKSSDKMAEENKETTNNTIQNEDVDSIYESIKNSVKSLTSMQKGGKKEMDEKRVNEMINNKFESVNKSIEDLVTGIQESNKEMVESFKNDFDALREETRESIEALKKEEESTQTPGEVEETGANKTDENVEGEAETDTETNTRTAGKGGKSYKHPEKPPVTKSAQIPNNYDGLGAGKNYHENSISEREYLMKFIKGKKTATKSLSDVKISYKGLSIKPEALPTAPAFSLIHPALKDSFSASFTVQGTEKLILNTQQYGLYMRELLSVDPLMDDAQFRIDYQLNDEERRMYALRYDEDPTQDGIMEEHYYFDNPDLTAAEIEVADQLLDPKPVRALLHISDRQILQNVFGENLLDNAMNLVQARYNEGVARINYFSDTTLANTNDIKFRRRDGLLKQAGVKLESDEAASASGDFDLDDGIEKLVKDMFRALPLEAQQDSLYNLYVPPFVYEAYREYYLNNDKINFIGNITGEIPLKYNKITVKEAPILADPAGIELAGDKVSCLLTSPENTHFCAGRALRIEPDRIASTSSTKYWYTGDFDCKFALPEYAVSATITKAEYEAL